METEKNRGPGVTGEHVVHVVAGLVDLTLSRLREPVERARDVLRRADLRDLVADARDDLATRGEIALKRQGRSSVPHTELLARRAAERERHADA